MREYSNKISLTKNSRGIYSLDTSIGCSSGMANEAGGCYNDCYAAKSAKLYGYDFSKTVLRGFESEKHRKIVLSQINKIKLDFVRIGTSGDPSENWEHTISILKAIDKCNKQIVIITKHWTLLTEEHLKYLSTINVCINTSVSALDKPYLREICVEQYNRLKPYCKSILRIVSCDFNLTNEKGKELNKIQHDLFKNEDTLDTVLRVNKRNDLVKNEIINVRETNFLGKKALVSKFNKMTYFGKCSSCKEMCGINIAPANKIYPEKRGILKQQLLFQNKKSNQN
jgi:hypothetical protein